MSQMQVSATSLLCELIESEADEINGYTLRSYPDQAGACLLQEKMLVYGRRRTWVKCPECRAEQARVVRDINEHQMMLQCPECLDVTADISHSRTHKVSMSRFISMLLIGLNLSQLGMTEIESGLIWKLGTTQKARGKPTTWYFARRLRSPRVANRLRQQIKDDNAIETCTVLTSTNMPLDDGSALAQIDARSLSSVGRIGKSTFQMFDDRLEDLGVQVASERKPRTTLKFLSDGIAYVEGEKFELEKQQILLLQALLEDRDREMTREDLREKCRSQAQKFSPRKVFDRNELVYKTFIEYQKVDRTYILLVDKDQEFYA
jgi:hypothetical protein